MNLGRNDPCPCGSGKKYKKCCGKSESSPLVQSWQQKANATALNGPAKGAALVPDEFSQLVALYNAGRHAELESRARLLVVRHPDFGLGWKLLSASLLIQGKDALLALQKTTKLLPDDAAAHYNLANNLKRQRRLDEAEASYRYALKIKPDYFEAYCNLGSVLYDIGRLDEAVTSYQHALQFKPDIAEVHYNLGNAFKDMGRLSEAEASFLRALQIRPDYIEARYSLASVTKTRDGDENLTALIVAKEAARNGSTSLSDKEQIFLHFALGKCHDDISDHEKAFLYFLEGCRLKRATLDYDLDKTSRYIDSVERVFDLRTIDRLRGGGDPSSVPIFVLGMLRSGTTLTEQIIASHPEVYGAGELPDLMTIASRNIAGATFPNNLLSIDQANLISWGAEYVAGLQQRAPAARRITDKMPVNFLAIGLIHLMLPNAKIIHVKRNPVDTCLSCFTQLFTSGQEYTYDLDELGRYYVDYVRMMEHWRRVLPCGAFLEVQYENIVANQEAQARRMIEFCGLEWNDACLDFHKTQRAVRTASLMQVRQPIYQSSVERWRPYEKFLGPLLDALGELVPGR